MSILGRTGRSRTLVLIALVMAGCGKKGSPLAPIVRIPAPIETVEVHRVGDEAYVTVTVPTTNIDASTPVDVGKVQIFGYTGTAAPSKAKWADLADLVATVPVATPAAGAPPPPAEAGAAPGASVTVRERLTPARLEPGPVDTAPTAPSRTTASAPVPAAPGVLRRFYLAIPFSTRGRPAPPGGAADLALLPLPPAPDSLVAPYTARGVALEWAPSGGVLGFLFDRHLPPEEPPLDARLEPLPQPPPSPLDTLGPVRYNVYRDVEADPLALPAPTSSLPWLAARPLPANEMPIEGTTWNDGVEFDRRRCYVVRAVRGTGAAALEGPPSEPTCFIPTDAFPPSVPTRLVAVADERGISLIWEPSGEADVAGYVVLRGEPGDATLQPLTPVPVADPRFRDTTVVSGRRYVYAVRAVDGHLPVPNVSDESMRVEEAAR